MNTPNRLVLATRNPGKVDEIRALLSDLPVNPVPASDLEAPPDVEEDAPDLKGNALKKAQILHAYTGLPTLADDTGLEVDALDGAPGVHTARYAGPDATPEDNCRRMLHELDGVDGRAARFRTVIAYVADGIPQYFEGVCEGHITTEPRGEGGFGYDPIFVPAGETRTFAEMTPDEKNALSHRKKALQHFTRFMEDRLHT